MNNSWRKENFSFLSQTREEGGRLTLCDSANRIGKKKERKKNRQTCSSSAEEKRTNFCWPESGKSVFSLFLGIVRGKEKKNGKKRISCRGEWKFHAAFTSFSLAFTCQQVQEMEPKKIFRCDWCEFELPFWKFAESTSFIKDVLC